MRRKKFRGSQPSFRSGNIYGPGGRRRGSGHGFGKIVAVTLVLAVVAAAIFTVVQLLRPVPSVTVTAAAPPMHVLPGTAPQPAWPVGAAEAAVGTTGVGMLAANGASTPRPIASLAKIMTAYVVLHDHPLSVGQQGPVLTVTAADVAAYRQDQQDGQSVVKLAAGETLTEQQALEAMLIPSGNNVADVLATWDAGSQTAFAAAMNKQARALGMHGSHYTDASGVDPATVSTAPDQFQLAVHALQNPIFAQIVAMPQVTLPVAGTVYNVNNALGHFGITGVKTGSTPDAGGCLVFSATRTVGGSPVTVVGAVLGVQGTTKQPSELAGAISGSENLLNSVAPSLEQVDVVNPGTTQGRVHAAWGAGGAAVAASGATVTGWPGMPVRSTVTTAPLGTTIRKGQQVGRVTVTVGSSVNQVPLVASQAVQAPSTGWRLGRF